MPIQDPDCRFQRDQEAFTLLEVLITVVIVAILAVLILPAVEKTQAQARASRCMNNLRQIGIGHAGYISDHNGALLPAAFVQPSGGDSWFNALEVYLGSKNPDFASKDRPAWQECPDKKFTSRDRYCVGYGWNFLYFGITLPGLDDWGSGSTGAGSTLASVEIPSRTIIVADSQDLEPANSQQNILFYGNYRWCEPQFPRRHAGRGNYLMLDGHIESMTPEEAGANDDYLFKRHKGG